MTTSIEQLFADLCAKHDLTLMSVEYSAESYRKWSAWGHWNGPSNNGISCASGRGDTPSDAIADMLAVQRANRGLSEHGIPTGLTMEAGQ